MKDRVRPPVFAVLFVASLSLPAPVAAQQGSGTAAQQSPGDDIVVQAEPGDRSLIDRETYIVRDTPLAQTKTAVEIIQNLPSVSVDAAGQLRLLGNRNVKILIDGRDVADGGVVLSTLQASQIARIEVMTNPSAQFSAYGSAGIINIVLRRNFADGLAGSVGAGAGNPGYFNARLSPTWSDGTWSVAVSPSVTVSDSRTDRLVERTGAGGDPGLNRTEDETGRGTGRTASAMGQVSFRPSAAKRYDLTAGISRIRAEAERFVRISSPLGAFAPFAETSTGRSGIDSESLSLERKATGKRDGEEFKLSLSWSHFATSARASYADLLAIGAREFAVANSIDQVASGIKADYAVPTGKDGTLSIGAELQRERQRILDTARGVLLSGPVDARNMFLGRWLDMSAYATFQARLGAFKVLPGLRVQRRRFEFGGASGLAPTGETLLFPSLHVERRFGGVAASFSVTRRADWPSIGQFFPYRRITGPTTVDTGNPELRPERTLGIEAAVRLPVAGQQVSLTLYDGGAGDVRDTAIGIAGNGDILSTPVNTGTRSNRGGQFSIRGKLASDWRYSASAWLADARFDRLAGATIRRDGAREYGANAQLEYSNGRQGERGFDQATLNISIWGRCDICRAARAICWGWTSPIRTI